MTLDSVGIRSGVLCGRYVDSTSYSKGFPGAAKVKVYEPFCGFDGFDEVGAKTLASFRGPTK